MSEAFFRKTSLGVMQFLLREAHLTLSVGNDSQEINEGTSPHIRVRLKDWQTLWHMVKNPRLGVGEAYQSGAMEIPSEQLVPFLIALLQMERRVYNSPWLAWSERLSRKRFERRQAYGVQESRDNVHAHYDVGNDFYDTFLDKKRIYSCAFFDDDDMTLEEAQENKLETTLKRAQLPEDAKVLEIGCGWGALSMKAADMGGGEVVGLTLSDQQYQHCKEVFSKTRHANRLQVRLQDYREHESERPAYYDRIVSVGMFEHVGIAQFERYFEAIHRLLKPGGRAVVHTITRTRKAVTNAWIDKYIFPGGYIPAREEIETSIGAVDGLKIDQIHKHDGIHYATTLHHWRERLLKNWGNLPSKYDERLRRTYDFYLAGCEAAFLESDMHVTQTEISKVD